MFLFCVGCVLLSPIYCVTCLLLLMGLLFIAAATVNLWRAGLANCFVFVLQSYTMSWRWLLPLYLMCDMCLFLCVAVSLLPWVCFLLWLAASICVLLVVIVLCLLRYAYCCLSLVTSRQRLLFQYSGAHIYKCALWSAPQPQPIHGMLHAKARGWLLIHMSFQPVRLWSCMRSPVSSWQLALMLFRSRHSSWCIFWGICW